MGSRSEPQAWDAADQSPQASDKRLNPFGALQAASYVHSICAVLPVPCARNTARAQPGELIYPRVPAWPKTLLLQSLEGQGPLRQGTPDRGVKRPWKECRFWLGASHCSVPASSVAPCNPRAQSVWSSTRVQQEHTHTHRGGEREREREREGEGFGVDTVRERKGGCLTKRGGVRPDAQGGTECRRIAWDEPHCSSGSRSV